MMLLGRDQTLAANNHEAFSLADLRKTVLTIKIFKTSTHLKRKLYIPKRPSYIYRKLDIRKQPEVYMYIQIYLKEARNPQPSTMLSLVSRYP